MLVGRNGNILKANPACRKILGVDEKEAKEFSKSPAEHFLIFDKEGRELPAERWPFAKIINKEKFKDEELLVLRKDNGRSFHASFTGKHELDETGNFIIGILYIKDITEVVLTKLELEQEISRSVNYDRDLAYYQTQLDRDHLLLQTIIDTIPVMITIYDAEVNEIILNKAVENITGWNSDVTRYKSIMELAYPDPEYREEVSMYMQSLKPGFKDLIMRTKDGRDIETSWANVKLPDGRQVGVGIDISGRKKLEADLILAREKAEKENQVQSAFIQNISHEVRTPMNSILGFTQLLSKRINEGQEKEYLDSITANGKQLLRLIDDIVDFSRLDKKEMTLSKDYFSLNEILEQTKKQIPGLKRRYYKKNLKISVKQASEETGKLLLYTDKQRLQQILTNLISNALKYTEKGNVEIGFILRKKRKDIIFYVRDTGIGIREADHKRVFSRFNRFHDTSRTQFHGTGLGLAICKHLVDMLGGKIWFDSKPGEGSVFYFTHSFTAQKAHKRPEAKSAEVNDKTLPKLANRSILIVEDDEYSFQMMKGMLMETEAEILHAGTGKEALKYFAEKEPDLVFLDIRLPEMDGFEVIREIRKKSNELPVIAQTANALPEDRAKSREAGFNEHITKPIDLSILYSILNRFLNK